MNGPRLLLVTRTFWPLADEEAALATRLAVGYQSRGWSTTVLTSRWLPHWPLMFDYNGITVARIAPRFRGWLGAVARRRRLHQWLEEHISRFQLAVVLGLDDDAATVTAAGHRLRFPVVLRTLRTGPTGDCHRQLRSAAGIRLRRMCAQAAAIVAASPLAEHELIAAGYPRDRIGLISPGIDVPAPKTLAWQREVRTSLGAAVPSLTLPHTAHVALYVMRPDQEATTAWLLQAWRDVAVRLPQSWLWLLGDARWRLAAERLISSALPLTRVVNADAFDDYDDFYHAADTFIELDPARGPAPALLQAMAAELPPIVAVEPGRECSIIDGHNGRRIVPREVPALISTLEEMQSLVFRTSQLGVTARQNVLDHYSAAAELDRFQTLFASIIKPA